MSHQAVSLSIFIAAYVLFVVLPTKRSMVASLAAFALVASGAVSASEAFSSVNWNVMGIFVGTLVVADAFMESGIPAALARSVVNRSRNTAVAILAICALTGLLSAFVENVATVLIAAPVALAMARELKIKPVDIMIAIAVSSNLQGAATLIGDPPSMLLGGYAKMNFFDFFVYRGRPGIFFAIEIAAVVSLAVLYFFFKKHTAKTAASPDEKIKSRFPGVMLVLLIAALAASSFFDKGFGYLAGTICMIFGAACFAVAAVSKKENLAAGIKKLDWDTTFFLIGVFVLVGGLASNGWIEKISALLSGLVGKNVFMAYTVIVFASLAISAFVDNVPYLAAMMPVAIAVARAVGIEPHLFLFGLLVGASIGGNVTPIGASANIVACGILRREGHRVSFGDFARIGVPFTLASTLVAYAFIWFFWK